MFPYESKVKNARFIQDQDLVYQASSLSIHKGCTKDSTQMTKIKQISYISKRDVATLISGSLYKVMKDEEEECIYNNSTQFFQCSSAK